MDGIPLLPLAVLLAVFAGIVFWLARSKRRQTGVPGGRIIYADTHSWQRVEKPLYDPELNLTGRPDYLVEQDGQIIPVEVKSTRRVEAPYDAHIYQLGSYCWLVERAYGKRPDYGILHYPDKTFAIDYTPQLEAELQDLVSEMQSQAGGKALNRSHQNPQRCARCGYRSTCDQALGI